jgi:hypothetical protein
MPTYRELEEIAGDEEDTRHGSGCAAGEGAVEESYREI